MNDEPQKPAWNTPTAEPAKANLDSYAALWRKQFVRNPFKLGPPGIIMFVIWLAGIALWVYGVYCNYSAAAEQGESSPSAGSQRLLANLSVLMLFGLLWGFLRLTSRFFTARTIDWAGKHGKKPEDIFN